MASINNDFDRNLRMFLQRHSFQKETFLGGITSGGQDWKWSEGSSWTFKNWCHQKPGNSGSQDFCVAMNGAGCNEGKWVDVSCDKKLPFMCKQKSVLV